MNKVTQHGDLLTRLLAQRQVIKHMGVSVSWDPGKYSNFICKTYLAISRILMSVDLLEKMLDLDADTRITAVQALDHPYLKQYADPSDEPTAEPFDQSFEDRELDISQWRKLVYEETISFQAPQMDTQ